MLIEFAKLLHAFRPFMLFRAVKCIANIYIVYDCNLAHLLI